MSQGAGERLDLNRDQFARFRLIYHASEQFFECVGDAEDNAIFTLFEIGCFASPAIRCPGAHAQRLTVDGYFDDVGEVFYGVFEVNFETRGRGQGFDIDVPDV